MIQATQAISFDHTHSKYILVNVKGLLFRQCLLIREGIEGQVKSSLWGQTVGEKPDSTND